MTKLSILQTFRLPANERGYWLSQCELFASHFDDSKILAVQLGKQDSRGAHSISLIDHRHYIPRQKFFSNSKELLNYIEGYNQAMRKDFNPFSLFVKE